MGALLALVAMMIDDKRSVILPVTAAQHGEGTTTIARELAAAAAVAWGGVALLDASGAGDGTAGPPLLDTFTRMQEPALRPGWINGVPVALGRLGGPGHGVPRLAAVRGLFAWLRSHYTLVVADCAPVLATRDTPVLAAAADGTLLVVAAGQTHQAEIGRARDVLGQFGASVLGVVLNKRRRL